MKNHIYQTIFSAFKIVFSEASIFYQGNIKPLVAFLEIEDGTNFTIIINF
jgi:hypothetical protein